MHHVRYFSDPSHGWLEVNPFKIREDLNLKESDFSDLSYTNFAYDPNLGNYFFRQWKYTPIPQIRCLYLEEDCDAGIFLQRHKEVFGEPPVVEEISIDYDAGIRSLFYINS